MTTVNIFPSLEDRLAQAKASLTEKGMLVHAACVRDAHAEIAALKARLAILQDALADIVDDELRRVQVECSNRGVKFSDDESLLSLFIDSRIARAHRLLRDEASP